MRFPLLCGLSLLFALGQANANVCALGGTPDGTNICVYTSQSTFDSAVALTNTDLSTLNFNGDIAYNNCSVSPCGNPFRSGYYSVGSHFTQDGVAFSGGPNLEFVYGAYGGSPDFPILNDSHDTGNLGIGVPSSSAVSLTLGDYVGSYPATITLNTGATVYELTLPQIPSTTFIGFVSSGSYITSLSLNDSGGSQGGLSLEDVQFTPEPGFYVVTGLLLIGLFVMRMRSAAASRSI